MTDELVVTPTKKNELNDENDGQRRCQYRKCVRYIYRPEAPPRLSASPNRLQLVRRPLPPFLPFQLVWFLYFIMFRRFSLRLIVKSIVSVPRPLSTLSFSYCAVPEDHTQQCHHFLFPFFIPSLPGTGPHPIVPVYRR